MHYDVSFEKPECFLFIEFFFFYNREYSFTVERLFLPKLLGFSFVQHWYYFSVLIFFKTLHFFVCTLHSSYLCKMSCLFFLFQSLHFFVC